MERGRQGYDNRTAADPPHPDRDGQFRYINTLAGEYLGSGDPVISVDAKKKELVGNKANSGREYQPKGQ